MLYWWFMTVLGFCPGDRHGLAEAEARYHDPTHKTLFVIDAGGLFIASSANRDHQRNQVVFARVGDAG